MTFLRFILFFALLMVALTIAGAAIVAIFGTERAIQSLQLFAQNDSVRRFSDRGLGVSFSYPREWKDEYLGQTMVRLSHEQSGMILAVREMEKEYTIEEYTKRNLQEITESAEHDGFTVVLEESSEIKLGGHEGRRIAALMEKEERVFRAIQVWTLRDKKVYSLSFSAPLGTYNSAVQSFENVIQSLKIR